MIAGLTKRLIKGAPLTSLEGDTNIDRLGGAIEDLASIPSNFPNADGATVEIVNNTIGVKDDGIGSDQLAPAGVNNTAMAADAIKPSNVASASQALTITADAAPVDWSLSWSFYVTLAVTTTLTVSFTNTKEGQPISIAVTQNGAGGKTVTWPTVKWSGGVAPVQTTTASKVDVYTFVKINGVVYGSAVQNCS